MANRMLAGGLLLLLGYWPVRANDPEVLHIGFVDSILDETAPSRRKVFAKEFGDLVRDFTGLKSVITKGLNPAIAAKQLDDEKWHLGVFHGVEFAWIMAKHPRLHPLMIATTRVAPVRAVLVVKKDSNFSGFADLKGRNISMLKFIHCQLFTDKATAKARDYFASINHTRSSEEALDGVFQDKFQGAVVDTPALAFYKGLQPGRFSHLKVAAESEAFPPALIAYREGCLSDKMLKHLQDSMLKVNQSDRGRESLDAFRLTGFQPAPADLQQNLTEILKSYPAPEF